MTMTTLGSGVVIKFRGGGKDSGVVDSLEQIGLSTEI